jgi:hypothetical protein
MPSNAGKQLGGDNLLRGGLGTNGMNIDSCFPAPRDGIHQSLQPLKGVLL